MAPTYQNPVGLPWHRELTPTCENVQDGDDAPNGGSEDEDVANGGGNSPGQDATEGGYSPGEDAMAGRDATEGGDLPGEGAVAGESANDGDPYSPGKGMLSDGSGDLDFSSGSEADSEFVSDYVLISELLLAAAAKLSDRVKIHFISPLDLLDCSTSEFSEKIRKILATNAKGRHWEIVPIKFQGHWLRPH
jgi:hypothetical protein